MNLVQQLAAVHAQVEKDFAERQRQQREQEARTAQRQAATKRAWETRKDGGKFGQTGLVAAVLARLPTGEANAILLAQVEALITDIPHAPSGLSATLVNLDKQGLVSRIGEVRKYRYFKPQ